MINKRVGLALFAQDDFAVMLATDTEDITYVYDPDYDDIEALAGVGHGVIVRWGAGWPSLIHTLQHKVEEGLDFVQVPARKDTSNYIDSLRREGLVTEDTKITKGF